MSKSRLSPFKLTHGFAVFLLIFRGFTAGASTLDNIGVTLLRATTTNLNGYGVVVADAEASVSNMAWEANPGDPKINLPPTKFTWYDNGVTATNFTNTLGTDSWHSDFVGGFFYGPPGGVSTNVAHIQNIQADYYYSTAVPTLVSFSAKIVNQSFDDSNTNNQATSDPAYDNYAAQYGTLFVTGVGNGGYVLPPSTSYNGIGVGVYGSPSSMGPTLDNGRAKPDLCAPTDPGYGYTSFATPLVSGAATLLHQAGWRGDGGADTNSATDLRTVKALLLNGAVKPPDWANPSPSPLDPLYGAGVLNVFNSYHQLTGGKQGFIDNTSVATNSAHPPTTASGNVAALSGWDFNTIRNTPANNDDINHYCFEVTNSAGSGPFTGTMTLVWNRQQGESDINHLDLYLYDMSNNNLVASSTSAVDNVQHIFVPQLPPGRYDLEVLKHAGSYVSASETYALAFDFFAVPLTMSPAPGGVSLSWPLYPAGFQLESNFSLASPGTWTSNNPYFTPVLTNNQNTVNISPATGPLFFRLVRVPVP